MLVKPLLVIYNSGKHIKEHNQYIGNKKQCHGRILGYWTPKIKLLIVKGGKPSKAKY